MESLLVSILHLAYVLCFAMIHFPFLAKQDLKISISRVYKITFSEKAGHEDSTF